MLMHPQQMCVQLLWFISAVFAEAIHIVRLNFTAGLCVRGRGENSYMGAWWWCCCCGYKPISRGNELCMSVISGLRSLCLLVDKKCLCGGACVCDA